MPRVEIVRSVEIDRPTADVFAFVADPRNDPRWCPKVRSVEQAAGLQGRNRRDVAGQLRRLKKLLERT
jgi:uncharacterized protein YndB with AHSA1/START domain